MRPTWIIALPLLAIAACSSEEERATLYKDCVTVFSDREISLELSNISTTPEAACTCLQAEISGEGDEQEEIGYFFARVSEKMRAEGQSAEDATGELAAQSLMQESENEGRFDEALGTFNEVFEEMMSEMRENDGACPAV